MKGPPPEEADVEVLRAMRAAPRRGLFVGLTLSVVAFLGVGAMQAHGRAVRSFVRGEVDLDGEPRFEPAHPASRARLARIDFARVHGELLPAWTIALGQATSPYWERRAEERFEDLVGELAPDPNLAELLTSAHRDLRTDPVERAHRLDYRLWAYNDYLDRHRVPYRLEAALAVGEDRAVLHTLSYRIEWDGETEAGDRLRLLSRADRTSSLEGWLGKTGRADEGAMVLMQRVLHFAVRHVWPAMHPALDTRRPIEEQSWLPAVREELARALDPATVARLRETAVDQQALIEVSEAVDARRACGSRFRLGELPYNGLSPRTLAAIHAAVARSAPPIEEPPSLDARLRAMPVPARGALPAAPEAPAASCPEITLDEAARLVGAAERLAAATGLERAIERLAMVVARSVAVHELRHVADGDALECPGCPEGYVGLARDEVSAYLHALGDEETGYLALLQACGTPHGASVHGHARRAVLEAVLPYGCTGPPHPALQEHARALEAELFGARPRVTLPRMPARVPLLGPARRFAPRPAPTATPLAGGWGLSLRGPRAGDPTTQ